MYCLELRAQQKTCFHNTKHSTMLAVQKVRPLEMSIDHWAVLYKRTHIQIRSHFDWAKFGL